MPSQEDDQDRRLEVGQQSFIGFSDAKPPLNRLSSVATSAAKGQDYGVRVMIPGEMFVKDGEIELNADRKTVALSVTNSGDRPIQVGSHYHFLDQPGAEVRSQKGARHEAQYRRRHGRALRAGPDARGHAGFARRQADDLRIPARRDGKALIDVT